MAITEWDDYLIHQTAKTIDAMESDDIDAMERFYVGCHNAEGTLHFTSGLGSYPNRNIMDGYVCVRHNDVQYNLRVSRHLQGDRTNTKVGPLSFKVIEPLKRWSVHIDDNDYGIRGSVEFEGRGAPYLTAPRAHYDHLGRFKGSITLEGQQFSVDSFIGARDRSWGMRRPNIFMEQDWGGHFWIQVHFSSFCLTLVCTGWWSETGRCGGAILNDDGSVIPITEMRHRIAFMPTVRALNSVEMLLTDVNDKQRHLIAKRISPVNYLNGGGYDRPGEDRGPLSIEGEKWDVSQMADESSPRFGLHQQIAEFQLDGEPGVGILEASFNAFKEREYKPSW